MQQAKSRDLTGAVPIIPIPFDASENIDEEALRQLVEFALAKGFAGICVPAYLSEFYKLSDEERIRVVKIAVDQAAGRLLVIAQSNHGSSRLALAAARLGLRCQVFSPDPDSPATANVVPRRRRNETSSTAHTSDVRHGTPREDR